MMHSTTFSSLLSIITAASAFPLAKREDESSNIIGGESNPSAPKSTKDADKSNSGGLPAGAILGIVAGFVILLLLVMLIVRHFISDFFSRAPRWSKPNGQAVSYANAWPGSKVDRPGKRNEKVAREVRLQRFDTDSSVDSEMSGASGVGYKFNGKQKLKVVVLEKALPTSPVGVAH